MGSDARIRAQLEDLFSELIAPSIVHEDALLSVGEPEGGIIDRREAREQREQLVYRALVENVADAVAVNDLEEVKAGHKLYLPTRLAEHGTEPGAPEGRIPPKPIPAYDAGLKARLRNSRVCAALRRAWQHLSL